MNKQRCLSLIIAIFVVSFMFFKCIELKQINPIYPDKPIHLFFESSATQPALSGMIDLVQLPKSELKILAWHRFPKRKDLMDLSKINAVEVPIVANEGYIVYNVGTYMTTVQKYLDAHPKSPIIVYTNMNNIHYFFARFLPLIPKNRIKHLHLYEDGLGELMTFSNQFSKIPATIKGFEQLNTYFYQNTKTSLPNYAKYMMHKIFPTTYHFYGVHKIQNIPAYKPFFQWMTGARLQNMDYELLAHRLTTHQKNTLFQLAGFDVNHYKQQFKDKKTFMFFAGYYNPTHHRSNHAELNYLKLLKEKYPDYRFFVKPHPSYDAFNRSKVLKDIFPDVEMIDPRIPYELFIIANLVPDKVAGTASSLFYNIKNEQLEGYFPHISYKQGLKKFQHFSANKELDLKMFEPQEPSFFNTRITKNGETDYLIFADQHNAFIYQRNQNFRYEIIEDYLFLYGKSFPTEVYKKTEKGYVFLTNAAYRLTHPYWHDFLIQRKQDIYCRTNNDCGKITKQKNTFRICWDEWGCETFKKQPDNTYRFSE